MKAEVEKSLGLGLTEAWSPFLVRGRQPTEHGDEVGACVWEARAHALAQILFLYEVKGQPQLEEGKWTC